MTRDELIEAMADDAKITKQQAGAALKSFCDHVGAALLAGEKLQIKTFGQFTAYLRGVANNLRDRGAGPAQAVAVSFKASTTLRQRLRPLADNAAQHAA